MFKNKRKYLLILSLSLIPLALSGCTPSDNPDTDVTNKVKVNLNFNNNEGSVSIVEDKDTFKAGNTVHLNVTPNENYEIVSVKANGEDCTLRFGQYSFKLIDGDNNVEVIFGSIFPFETTKIELNEKNSYYTLWKNKGYPHLKSTGKQKLLVVPVALKGAEYDVNKTEQVRADIDKTFFGDSSDTGWESVSSFYKKSSYGKLELSGEVTPWIDLNITPEELGTKKTTEVFPDGGGTIVDYGTYYVLNYVIDYIKTNITTIDLKDYDNDKDGFIDGIYLIYNTPDYIHKREMAEIKDTYFWNFTYYNIPNKDLGDVNNPVSMTYSWGSYDNMYFGYGTSKLDAHLYIHEMGHVFGLTDYYDTRGADLVTTLIAPMGGSDMMDHNIGDHSPFTKYALGWTSPTLISGTKGKKMDYSLGNFAKDGDFIILKSSDFNDTPFDNYVVIEYLKIEDEEYNLNYKDAHDGYINSDFEDPHKPENFYQTSGVRITHIDARAVAPNPNYDGVEDQNRYVFTDDIDEMVTTNIANTPRKYYAIDAVDKNTQNPLLLTTVIPSKMNLANCPMYTPYTANSEDTLWHKGNTFTLNKSDYSYRDYFPTQTNSLNDYTEFNFSVTIGDMTADSVNLSIF